MYVPWATTGDDDDIIRRRKILYVEPSVLVGLCQAGFRVFEVSRDALPDDARVINVQVDPYCERVALTVVSAEWPMVPEHHIPAVLAPPCLTTYTGEDAIVKRLREIEAEKANAALAEVMPSTPM